MYNEELERLINAAIADGKISDSEKSALRKKATSLGIDLDEFNLELDARLLELQQGKLVNSPKEIHDTKALEDAKIYIANFCKKFNETEVYAPTGKYGKKELVEGSTYQKKRELIMTEMPSTPERLREFLLFLENLNGYSRYRKIQSLIDCTDKTDLRKPILKDVVARLKKKIRKQKTRIVMKRIGWIVGVIICVGLVVLLIRSSMWQFFKWSLAGVCVLIGFVCAEMCREVKSLD